MAWKNKVFVLVLLFVSCHENGLSVVSKCDTICYTGGFRPVGECRAGIWKCNGADDITAVCTGQILPSIETCNGLDDDCDGRVDNYEPVKCSTSCGEGKTSCVNGAMSCSARKPTQEICNGLDDNCDGQIDEPENLTVAPCYTGNPKELQYGQCRFGATRCLSGTTVCYGQVLPSGEICNGIDDNCNGIVDDGFNDKDLDIVFIIDNSQSMFSKISTIKDACRNFSVKYSTRNIKWGLVTAPDMDGSVMPKLYLDLTTPLAFLGAINLQDGSSPNGDEPTLDALNSVCDLQNNPLKISWRQKSVKYIVLVTDEEPQSYSNPKVLEADAQLTCNKNKFNVLGIVDYRWNSLISGLTNGKFYEISSMVSSDIENKLDTIIKEVYCN